MNINGFGQYLVDWGYQPQITMALTWKQWSDGNWRARDRGIAQDVHSTTLSLTGDYYQISALDNTLKYYRDKLSMSSFNLGEEIFGPHVDYSGSYDVVVKDFGQIKRTSFQTYSIPVTLEMVGVPTLISDTVSVTTFKNDLYALKSVDYSQDFGVNFTNDPVRHYDGSFDYLDRNIDMGTCNLTVHDWTSPNATNKVRTIIKSILTQVRSDPFGWISNGQPHPWGPPQVFGTNTPGTPYAKLLSFGFQPRQGVIGWDLDLKFVEHKFTHDGT